MAPPDRGRLSGILAEWYDRRERGQPADTAEVLRRHPDLAEDLQAHFAALEVFEEVASRRTSPRSGPPRTVGKFRVLREIGRGGMGVVFEAEQPPLGRRVALKVLHPAYADGEKARSRFRREAALASRLDHPHLCTVYEADADAEPPFIAMRFVEGETLAARIEAARSAAEADTPVPVLRTSGGPGGERADLLRFFEKAARALHAAHEAGLVHRDVKPANIMVTGEGEPVVLDFGLARGEGGGSLTLPGARVGTPAYMSPEQILHGSGEVDRRTDVYSLGVTLYECLGLRPAYEAATDELLYKRILETDPEELRSCRTAVSRDLRVVLGTAMDKDPGRRYSTALAFAEDLHRVLAGEPVRARPSGAALRVSRWVRRNPYLAASLGAVILALAGGLAVSMAYAARSRDSLRRARALGLVSASVAESRSDPMRGLLLAREAVRTEPLPACVSRLHEALAESFERAVLSGHGAAVRDASFSPGGRRILTASTDGTAALWEADGRRVAALPGHGAPVRCASWSPDGQRILTGSEDGTARLWDGNGRLLEVLEAGGGFVLAAAFSPRGDLAVTSSGSGIVRLWDLRGRPVRDLCGPGASAIGASFSPDGGRVIAWFSRAPARVWTVEGAEVATLSPPIPDIWSAGFIPRGRSAWTANRDGTAHLWDLESPGKPAVLGTHVGGVRGVASSPDGTRLLTYGEDGEACLWTGEGLRLDVLRGHGSTLWHAEFSTDGTRILTSGNDGTARLWDAQGRSLGVFAGHVGDVWRARFSDDGERVVTASNDRTARVWDASAWEVAVLRGHAPGNMTGLALSPDRTRILSGSEDGTARLWSAAGAPDAVLEGHEGGVASAAWSPRGDLLATGSGDRTARLWRGDGSLLTVLPGHADRVECVAISPAGDRIATAGGASVLLWDERGNRVAGIDIEGPSPIVHAIAFSPAGDRLVTGASAGTLGLYEPSGKRLRSFGRPGGPVQHLAWSPTGDRILDCSIDGTAGLWDAEGTPMTTLGRSEAGLLFGCFSPDGRRILTAGNDHKGRLWTSGGDLVAELVGHGREVQHGAFSPDGTRAATGSVDGTARVWDLEGREIAVLRGHRGPVRRVAFIEGGARLVTTSEDGTLRIWELGLEELTALAAKRSTRGLTPGERARFAEFLR